MRFFSYCSNAIQDEYLSCGSCGKAVATENTTNSQQRLTKSYSSGISNNMKRCIQYLKVVPLILLWACSSNSNSESKVEYAELKSPHVEQSPNQKNKVRVQICPYGDFDSHVINFLHNKLEDLFEKVEVRANVDFPAGAWYEPRQRYRAPKLLDYQQTLFTCKSSERGKSEYILGVTSKDISLKYKEYEDWGVMGLSYLRKGVSVISTFRLGGIQKMNKDSFYKLALHELGHAAGLPHCEKSKTCIMRDAKGKDHFPQLTDFCPSCKAYLQERGWKLQ